MFEHHHQPLIPASAFIRRALKHALFAFGIVVGSLGIGMLGYHGFEGLSWLDAFVNSAMLLGGMGPIGELHTTGGKLFAAFYALYSGLVFLVVAAVLFGPVIHRLLHQFHLEMVDEKAEA